VKVGDIVRYRESKYISDRVHKKFFGLIIKCDNNDVCVKWNTRSSSILWHNKISLQLVTSRNH
jgi:hypothetical protein